MGKWYILSSRKEGVVFNSILLDLARQDPSIKVWTPCYFIRTSKGVQKKPLYPGYVFVKWEYDLKTANSLKERKDGFYFLKENEDVGDKGKDSGAPYVVKPEEIKTMQAVEDFCYYAFTHSDLKEIIDYGYSLGINEEYVEHMILRLGEIKKHEFTPGETIEVTEGPFSHLKGVVVEMKGDYVAVEFNLFARQTVVVVGANQCQKLRSVTPK